MARSGSWRRRVRDGDGRPAGPERRMRLAQTCFGRAATKVGTPGRRRHRRDADTRTSSSRSQETTRSAVAAATTSSAAAMAGTASSAAAVMTASTETGERDRIAGSNGSRHDARRPAERRDRGRQRPGQDVRRRRARHAHGRSVRRPHRGRARQRHGSAAVRATTDSSAAWVTTPSLPDAATDHITGGDGDDSLNAKDHAAGDTLRGSGGVDTCAADVGDVVHGCP